MHTKGPWNVVEGSSLEIEAGDFYVAFCGPKKGLDVSEIPQRQANARLIAAAPELLEALELCYEHCRLYHPEVETNNVGEQVRAAIKKARGIKTIHDVKSLIEWVTYNFECSQGDLAAFTPHEGRMLAYHSLVERVPLAGLNFSSFPDREREERIAGACQLIAMTLDAAKKATGKDRPTLYWRLPDRILMQVSTDPNTEDTALYIRTRVAIPGVLNDKVF